MECSSYLRSVIPQSKVSVRGTGKLYAVRFESTTDMNWELDGYSIEVDNVGKRGSRSY